MSWRNFSALIDEGSTNIADWQAAVRANPSDPAGALKAALLDIYGRKDMTALENFCARVIELVERRDAEEMRK